VQNLQVLIEKKNYDTTICKASDNVYL